MGCRYPWMGTRVSEVGDGGGKKEIVGVSFFRNHWPRPYCVPGVSMSESFKTAAANANINSVMDRFSKLSSH